MPRRTPQIALTVAAATTALFVVASSAVPVPSPAARAQDDPRREARLLFGEGKFREAEKILADAGKDVQQDLELRAELAQVARKWLEKKTGEERRPGLEAVARCFTMVAEAKGDGLSLVGAIVAQRELAELDLAQRRNPDALARASAAIALAEKIGSDRAGPAGQAALGQAYGLRAKVTRKPDKVDAVVADYRKGADLLVAAAKADPKGMGWLAAASALRLEEAVFVHDTIPLETEKRDDEALAAAIDLATQACRVAGAADEAFDTHCHLLHVALEWKVPSQEKVFTAPVKPDVDAVKLLIPKGSLWKKQESEDWKILYTRRFADDPGKGIQLMAKLWPLNASYGGKQWRDLADVVTMRYDGAQGDFESVASEMKPAKFGGKKSQEVWHFQISGMTKSGSLPQRRGEWYLPAKDGIWQIKVIDWRRPSAIEDPDIAVVVNSIIGVEGYWPGGVGAEAEEKGGKEKKDKKKK